MKDSSITALVAVGGSGQIESSDYFSEQWRKIKGKREAGGEHTAAVLCTLGRGPPLRPGLTCAGGLCAPFSPTDPGAQKRSPVSEGTLSPLQSTRQPC